MTDIERPQVLDPDLGWSVPANLRWLADNRDAGRVPCGWLTGEFLKRAADLNEQLASELSLLRERVEADRWQPIETHDGSREPVLVWGMLDDEDGEEPVQAAYTAHLSELQSIWWLHGPCLMHLINVTHWRPLPSPPQGEA